MLSIFHRCSIALKPIQLIIICGLLSLSTYGLSAPLDVNFDEAMHTLGFDVNADSNGKDGENGIAEGFEMGLLSAILADADLDLSKHGGVTHKDVYHAYQDTLKKARIDLASTLKTWPRSAEVITAYVLLGEASRNAINQMTTGFASPLNSDYSMALSLEKYLGPEGDADGDGYTNRQEYHAFGKDGREAYIHAALNTQKTPNEEQLTSIESPKKTRFTIGIILYPGFEVLDVYGPLEMWANVPGFNVVLIAQEAGPVVSAQRAATIADYDFTTAPKLDIVMVPGGNGTRTELENPTFINYLKKVHEDSLYTTSVCTGSALLAKAGILDGQQATTNKRFFFLSEQQSDNVDWVVNARWIESGKIFTSSGVSAGIDMALGLIASVYDKATARELANAVEYNWHEDQGNDPFAKYVNRLVPEGVDVKHHFVKSLPSADSHIKDTPRYLHLFFDKAPQVDHSEIRLYHSQQKSQSIPLTSLHTMGANDLMVSVNDTLPEGEYTVHWRTQFADSKDIFSDKFTFTVKK